MTTTNEYTTRHVGLASFLRYCLGDQAHVATGKAHNGTFNFFFDDADEKCREFENAFFGEEGVAVGDARALLECSKDVRTTIAKASRAGDGTWEAERG
jgi:hypothetical protein